MRAYLTSGQPLPEETEHYKALVAGLWSERDDEQSATFAAWRARVQERAATRAHAPVSGGHVTLAYGQSWEGAPHQGVDIGGQGRGDLMRIASPGEHRPRGGQA